MKAKTLLLRHLEENKDRFDEDPLHFTKEFLDQYNITYKDFFGWIVEEASRFNWTINSDKNVKTFLQ